MTSENTAQSPRDEEAKKCSECGGRGWKDHRCLADGEAVTCMTCNGRGYTLQGTICQGCHGTGLLELRTEDFEPCPLCGGAGVYPVPSWFTSAMYAFHTSHKSRP